MAIEIDKLIAAISPDVYCAVSERKKVKQIIREGLAKASSPDKRIDVYLEAAKKATPFKSEFIFDFQEATKNPLDKWGLKSPSQQHELSYDSTSESLEPLYFWILDFLEKTGHRIEKITDNFASSPGSGHFSEIGQKATRMQEEAMKMLGATNQVVKSILNLVYDLKEFKILLTTYDELKSQDPQVKSAAMLSLKQRWMDLVDQAKRGTTSIKQLAAQFDYVTLIDAFMAADSLKRVNEMDLNDRVKRLLQQRISDFFKWLEESEKELRKRYQIEKRYLKSQVNTVKLYARWIAPYLKAARKLENVEPEDGTRQAGLVSAFNTSIMELVLLAKKDYDPKDDVKTGTLPKVFEEIKTRRYYSLVFVDFNFRGLPYRISQRGDWSFGGRTDMKFKSYSLNEEELGVLKKVIERDRFGDVMKLIEGVTSETLAEIQNDIDAFLNEDEKKEEEKEKSSEDINPFTALFSFFTQSKKKDEKNKDVFMNPIKPDNSYEEIIRSQAIISARDSCFNTFDIYKRAHGMPAHVTPFDPLS